MKDNEQCTTVVTHTACEWFVYCLNIVGVGFRNVGEFGATVWIRLCYMRDASPKYSSVYFWACTYAVVLVFADHLVILLCPCLCVPWKFLVRVSYMAIIYLSCSATYIWCMVCYTINIIIPNGI